MQDTDMTKEQLIAELNRLRQYVAAIEASALSGLTQEERLAQLTLALTSQLSYEAVLDETLRQMRWLVPYDTAHIMLLREDTLYLAQWQGYEIYHNEAFMSNLVQSLADFPADRAVVESRKPLVIADTRQDPRWVQQPETDWIRSHATIPIRRADRVLGLLRLDADVPDKFSETDVERLQPLANAAAVALENADLYEQMRQELAERKQVELELRQSQKSLRQSEQQYQRQAKELAALNRASRAITSTLDLQSVLDQMMNEVRNLLEAELALVLLLTPDDEALILSAIAPPAVETLLGARIQLDEDILGSIIEEKQSVMIADTGSNAKFRSIVDTLIGPDSYSLLATPMILGEAVLGVIEVVNRTDRPFTHQDMRFLEAFTHEAVIAVENARLYETAKYHAEQLAVLHEIDQAITSSLRITDVYQAFAQHVARLFPYDGMSITLLEGDRLEVVYSIGFEAKEPFQTENLTSPKSAVGWVLAHKQPLLHHRISHTPYFAEDKVLWEIGLKSFMIVPLHFKNRIIGTWNLGSRYAETYSVEDLTIAQSLADQLVIAIENARLYESEQEQYRRLQQSQAQLIQVEKMAALGRLVASIAHEINNPLQSVRSCLGVIRQELEEILRQHDLEEIFEIAETEIERISSTVRHMRDFYHPLPGDGSMQLFYQLKRDQLERVDVHTVLENVHRLVKKELAHNFVRVEYQPADSLPLIEAHSNYLKQIFLNMFLNAIDTMAPDGGTLTINTALTEALLNRAEPVPVVRIRFSDTGDGIPAQLQPLLFEPFFTTKEKGSGLGLFTTYKIIEVHHGSITVDSQLGQGTTFTILLPVEQRGEDETERR